MMVHSLDCWFHRRVLAGSRENLTNCEREEGYKRRKNVKREGRKGGKKEGRKVGRQEGREGGRKV